MDSDRGGQNRSDAIGGTLELTEREARLVEVPWESTVTMLDLSWDVPADTRSSGNHLLG